jgi:hypothetical protein
VSKFQRSAVTGEERRLDVPSSLLVRADEVIE